MQLTAKANEAFRFVVISDPHVRIPGYPDACVYDNQGNQDNLRRTVERIGRDFADVSCVVVTGDLVGCLFTEDPSDEAGIAPALALEQILSELPVPYRLLLGNHDYQCGFDVAACEGITSRAPDRMETIWRKVFGIEPFSSEVRHGVRFVYLNSNRGAASGVVCDGHEHEAMCTGSFDDAQLAWLERELLKAEPCLLFVHHPPVTDDPTVAWASDDAFQVCVKDRFYEVVEASKHRVLAIFAGHGHVWARDTLFETIAVLETAATGDGRGAAEQFHVVTVSAKLGIVSVDRAC